MYWISNVSSRRRGDAGRVQLVVARPVSGRHLLFRDYLRASSEARTACAEVKFVASGIWRGDRMGYNAAKTGVILDIMEKSETWAADGRR
jgi:GrpB-like predicted nucleotidyltransferase (UPF0157 family)